jgi:hypothetical protein
MHHECKIESQDEQNRRNGRGIGSRKYAASDNFRCCPCPRPAILAGRDPFTLSFEGGFSVPEPIPIARRIASEIQLLNQPKSRTF